MGPIVKCYQPIVDYGLVKVNSQEDFEIEIQNESPIAAEILLKKSDNERLDFTNMLSMEQAGDRATNPDTFCLIYNKALKTKGQNTIYLDQQSLKLEPFEK